MEELHLPLIVANTVKKLVQPIIFDGQNWYVFGCLLNRGEVRQVWVSVDSEDIKKFIHGYMPGVVQTNLLNIEDKIANLALEGLEEANGLLVARKLHLDISQNLPRPQFRTLIYDQLSMACTSFSEVQKMDRSNIWACKNTVIDFETGPVEKYGKRFVRPGRFDDYMSMSCGLNYLGNPAPETTKKLDEYLKTTFPREDTRELFLDEVTLAMSGKTRVITFFGGGASGKSTAQNILMEMFGDYGLRCHIESFDPGTGLAHKFLISSLKGKKLIFIAQPLEEVSSKQIQDLYVAMKTHKFSVLFCASTMRRDMIRDVDGSAIHFENRFSSLPVTPEGWFKSSPNLLDDTRRELAETLLHTLIKRLCLRYHTIAY